MKKLETFPKKLTRVVLGLDNSFSIIKALASLSFLLEIAVNSIITMTLHIVRIITHPILKSCRAVSSMVHINYEITISPILKHNISTKKLQTNEMKLITVYQLCDHGSSLVPVIVEKK